MRFRFIVDGQAYSKNKSSFKTLLKKYNLKWKGSFDNFLWANEREKVKASFERDAEKDVTLSATLIWEGRKKSDFVEELKAWVWELGGSGDKEDVTTPKSSETESHVKAELEFWDNINKPDVEHLKATGCPKEWIENELKTWKKRRREKKKELMEKYSD